MIDSLLARLQGLNDRSAGSCHRRGSRLVLLVIAVVMPLHAAVSQSGQRVARKQADLGWIRQMAPALAAAPRAVPARRNR